MLIIIPSTTTKKIISREKNIEITKELKQHTKKYLFNIKEGRNGETETLPVITSNINELNIPKVSDWHID